MLSSKNRARGGRGACAALVLALAAGSWARPASAAPYFQDVPDAFGVQACPGHPGCYTNYVRMTDIDGDGDLDILFPNSDGYFAEGNPEPLVVYLNDGEGQFSDQSAAVVGGFSGYLRQIAVGDIDGDKDLDVYAPAAWGDPDALFINAGAGVLADEAATRLPDLRSHAGATRFGDVDGDGDLDLLVSDGWAEPAAGPAHLYLNDGAGVFTDASASVPTTHAGDGPIDFDLLDADGDFDLDLLIDMHTGTSSLWLNDSTGHFTDAAGAIPPQGSLKYGPVACDVDGDGDLDLWFDNAGPDLTEELLINDGSGHFTDETDARVTGNLVGADDNGLACIDVDGDGDLDAAIMSLSKYERVLLNDGTGRFALLSGAFPELHDSTLWFDFGDVDGDGRLDCVTAQGESGFLDRLYVGTSDAPVDALAPRMRAVEAVKGPVAASATPVVRFAVSDSATTDEGPRLSRAYVRVTLPDASTEIDAVFVGGDMFRAVLPAEASGIAVSYAACAVDRRGNEACADTQSYVVDGASSSGTGGSGQGGAGQGGAGQGGAGQGGAAHAGGASASTPGEGGGSDEPFVLDDDGGCGCSVPGSLPARVPGLFAALMALATRWRRRRASALVR